MSGASAREALAGLVERVTFHGGASGFCVLSAETRGRRDPVTVIGHAPAVSAGQWITIDSGYGFGGDGKIAGPLGLARVMGSADVVQPGASVERLLARCHLPCLAAWFALLERSGDSSVSKPSTARSRQ